MLLSLLCASVPHLTEQTFHEPPRMLRARRKASVEPVAHSGLARTAEYQGVRARVLPEPRRASDRSHGHAVF